jgi:hypothetical protein
MDRMATKTLAEVYLQQGHFHEAYEIFKALAEKDPHNLEIRHRLEQLSEKLNLSLPLADPPLRTREEKIRFLEKWLANIHNRRRG